jgi:hypothetical protein
MTEVCPVNERQVNENIARLNALATIVLMSVFLFTPVKWILFILPVDFALRSWLHGRFSPLGRMNRLLARSLHLKEIMINEGPKVFAARIGLILSALALGSFIAGFSLLAYILGGILVFFSFLEAAFGFCVACKIYPLVFRRNLA